MRRAQPRAGVRRSYGGVVWLPDGRVLLRQPRACFGGYVWTWAKGGAEPGETPEQAAVREVREELGVAARILAPVAGWFAGDTTDTRFWVMAAAAEPNTWGWETAEVIAVWPTEVPVRLGESRTVRGRLRDLTVWEAARLLQPRWPRHAGVR